MAPVDDDAELAARKELSAIHPQIRAQITGSMDLEVWKAMSFVEKLQHVKEKMPAVADNTVSEFDRWAAQQVADGAKGFLDAEPEKPSKQNKSERTSSDAAVANVVASLVTPEEKPAAEEDPEAAATRELMSIHPSVRFEIVKSLDQEKWKAMSTVEKLATVKEKLPSVKVALSDFEKEAARMAANREESFFDGPPEGEVDDDDDDDDDEEVIVLKKYWAPKGRCPYGMDRGSWEVTVEEMRQHDSKQSCWVSIEGHVFDVTKWQKKHPGGAEAILQHAGQIATEAFKAVPIHATSAPRMLQKYHVGRIATAEEVALAQKQASGVAPEVCPVTGKTGDCPVYGKTEEAPAAAGTSSDDVCPISGKVGACPMKALHKQHDALPAEEQAKFRKASKAQRGAENKPPEECTIS